ncbi:glycosyltransferase [Brevundimonas sp. LM2]|uniref:glycosyltransferase n=1 Tax=Brevundimonas sp. LM2 TaxID=1938605 RepID=UPI0009838C3D|nr:glycosyltransferase [Brevundimonas sp. LM2]AQR62860.1 glycosyltransferase [Brevundimonas sp. LM2]
MIGYYVHHHGIGHLTRARAITAGAPERFTLMGTGLAGRTDAVAAMDLADDRPEGERAFNGQDGAANRPDALHYAPLGHAGVRRRVADITGWIAQARPALMVVDVSVEVALLARLAATPTVCVRLAGRRTDPAHLEAFRGATAILAPFHPDLEDLDTPDWVRAKTRYAPGLTATAVEAEVDEAVVVVVFGAGGGASDGEALAAAARRTPDLTWRVLGPMSPVAAAPPNLVALGWVEDAAAEIAAAGVVIGSAGNGVIGAVLAADRPFLCLPQDRPFDEQRSTGRGLAAAGAAVLLEAWPDAEAWPDLLAAARRPAGEARTRLIPANAGQATCDWLLELADRSAQGAAH